jgi:hypothetical protein
MKDLTTITNEKLIDKMLNNAARYGTSASGLCIDIMGSTNQKLILDCKKELLRRLEKAAANVV